MIERAAAYWRATAAACGRWSVVRLQLLQLLAAVLEGAVLGLVIPLVQVLAGADQVSIPLVHWHLPAVATVGLLAAAVALRGAVQWGSAVATSDVRLRTTDALRLDALIAVLHAEWTYVAKQRRSDIVQATTTEIERAEIATALFLHMGTEILVMVATIAVGVAISPLIGALAALALVVVAIPGWRSLRRSTELGVEWSERNALFSATVTDSLASLRLIRAHDAADQWAGLLRSTSTAGRRIEHRYVEITAGLQAVIGMLGVVIALGLVLVGRSLGLGVAELITLAVVTTRMLTLARELLQSLQGFAHHSPALDAVRRITADARRHAEGLDRLDHLQGSLDHLQGSLDHRQGSLDQPRLVEPVETPPTITLRSITAGYAEEPAVRGLDLEIPAGSLVAVVGPSGTGKSTLIDVILGLLPATSGTILADGVEITDRTAWRARLGYVPQQTVLIPATVRENLTWSAGRPTTDEDLWQALETACAADVVRRLPDGLDTQLRDNAQLSGGEQQRLCIARALARDPGVLLLDEATSALDTETERAVLERLRASGRTLILATHRGAVADASDQIVRLTRA